MKKMKKILRNLVLAGGLVALGLTGCAKACDRWEAEGSFIGIGSTNAPYVVISQSGGEIMDVYKLPNTVVQSPETSDGWLFTDNDGNPVYLGGDVKTIRLDSTNDPTWDRYHEYHMELESETYREKYNPAKNTLDEVIKK